MTNSELNNHLHTSSERILQKWQPTIDIIKIKYNSNFDHDLSLIFSQFGEFWEITRPNYDGLSDVFDRILIELQSQEFDLSNVEDLKKIFPEDFIKCYDIQHWRNSQINKLWQN